MARRRAKTIILPYLFEPRPAQETMMDYYDQGGLNGIWVWHRRFGKDLTSLHQTCKMAHQRKGMYWHCLPTFSQARKAVWNAYDNSKGERLLATFICVAPPRRRRALRGAGGGAGQAERRQYAWHRERC